MHAFSSTGQLLERFDGADRNALCFCLCTGILSTGAIPSQTLSIIREAKQIKISVKPVAFAARLTEVRDEQSRLLEEIIRLLDAGQL
jgi:hypothetical protein